MFLVFGGVPTFEEEPASFRCLPAESQNAADLGGLRRVAAALPQVSWSLVVEPKHVSQTIQGKHHYTRGKQIKNLARMPEETGPDMGFMARLLTLCALPRTDPGDQLQYKRQNGPYKLVMIAGGENRLPFGNFPGLLLSWLYTEAIRMKERRLMLGSSLFDFMRKIGINNNSSRSRVDRAQVKEQIDPPPP